MNPTQEQLDPSIIALTKAIGRQESGGDYARIGDNGHSKGAYQWNNSKAKLAPDEIPANFRDFASQVGADANDFSPANQDRVAYKTIEKWGKEGLTPAQIASKWNSGDPEKYKTAKPGYNAEQGVKHDVKGYVDSVAKYYQEYAGSTGSSSSGGTDLTKDQIIQSTDNPAVSQTPSQSQFSKASQDLGQGNILGAIGHGASGLVQGVGNALTGGGSNTLGELLGTNLGYYAEKVKGAFGGQDNSQYYDTTQPSVKDVAKAGVKTGGAVIGLAAGGGLLGKLLSKSSALKNPTVIKTLETAVGKGETAANLTRREAIMTLENTLKEMSLKEAGGKKEQLLLKALKELNPTAIEKKGIISRLLRGGVKTVSQIALLKLLGDKVGGAVHRVID